MAKQRHKITGWVDCWTREEQWLSLGDLCQILQIKPKRGFYYHLLKELKGMVDLGLFERVKKPRVINFGKNRHGTLWVYHYKPKPHILKTLCDGYFDKAWEDLSQGKR